MTHPRTDALFRAVYSIDLYEMKFKRAVHYLYELQTAILCTCDGMAAEQVSKQLKVVYEPIIRIQKDSSPKSSLMKMALDALKEETGRKEFDIKEVQDRMEKGGF